MYVTMDFRCCTLVSTDENTDIIFVLKNSLVVKITEQIPSQGVLEIIEPNIHPIGLTLTESTTASSG